MTICFVLAILQVWIIMQNSINAVFTEPHPVLMIYTSFSHTNSVMRTFVLPMPLCFTSARVTCIPSLDVVSCQGDEAYMWYGLVPFADGFCQLWVTHALPLYSIHRLASCTMVATYL